MNDQEKHRQEGLKALALAKKAEKIRKKKGMKPIYVGKGITGDILSDSLPRYNPRTQKKLTTDHDAVMKMLNEGATPSETAKKFNITQQMVSYIKNKIKTA